MGMNAFTGFSVIARERTLVSGDRGNPTKIYSRHQQEGDSHVVTLTVTPRNDKF